MSVSHDPERAPTWGGVIGGVLTAILGICWTGAVVELGAPRPFVVLGGGSVLSGLAVAVYHWKKVTAAKRSQAIACLACGAVLGADGEVCPSCGKARPISRL